MPTPPFVTRVYIDFATEIDFGPDEPRTCPTCGAAMEQAGKTWVCPTARTEARVVSNEVRQGIRAIAAQRTSEAPF